MATQKRRIVYLSDEQWATAQARAETMGVSISGYVAKLLTFAVPAIDQPPDRPIVHAVRAWPKPSQRGSK